MKIVASYSIKGGVGKTSTAVNIAWLAADAGLRTLLVDLDPQGAASYCFRIKAEKKSWLREFFQSPDSLAAQVRESDFPRLDLIPAQRSFRSFDLELSALKKSRNRLRKSLQTLAGSYDVAVLDCPPSLSLLAENIFAAADIVLVPVIPAPLAERSLAQLQRFFHDKGLDAGTMVPFLSMVQATKRLHREVAGNLRQHYPRLLRTAIPFSADVERMSLYRAPIARFARSRPVMADYSALWQEVRALLKV